MTIKEYLEDVGVNTHGCVILNFEDVAIAWTETMSKYKRCLYLRNTIHNVDLRIYTPKGFNDTLFEIYPSHNGLNGAKKYRHNNSAIGVGIKKWHEIVELKDKLKEFLDVE